MKNNQIEHSEKKQKQQVPEKDKDNKEKNPPEIDPEKNDPTREDKPPLIVTKV